MWKFSFIKLSTYYSWPFIDIPLQCSGYFRLKRCLDCHPSLHCTVLLETISHNKF
jgi:hypothetical protein